MHEQFVRIDAVLTRSGVSLAELAQLAGIQKCTLMGWKRGAYNADNFRHKIVLGYIELIDKAVNAGRLPLATTPLQQKARDARVNSIKQILTEIRKTS